MPAEREDNKSGRRNVAAPFLERWKMFFGNSDAHVVKWEELLGACFNGDIRNSHLRTFCWRLLLGVLPTERSEWLPKLKESRENYARLKRDLFSDPRDALSSEINLSLAHPLSLEATSPWRRMFEETTLFEVINRDVIRTFPEVPFFQSDEMRETIANVLFVYARQNPHFSYKQGMHEILAPIIFSLCKEAETYTQFRQLKLLDNKMDENVLKFLDALNDFSFQEHDAFAIFEKVFALIAEWYEPCKSVAQVEERQQPCAQAVLQKDKFLKKLSQKVLFTDFPFVERSILDFEEGETALHKKLRKIHCELLLNVDPLVYTRIQELHIQPQIFGIRWLRLLYGREFSLGNLLCLWDALFASNNGKEFVLVDYVYVALLVNIHQTFVEGDQSECLKMLVRYPEVRDVDKILRLAKSLKWPQYFPMPGEFRRLLTASQRQLILDSSSNASVLARETLATGGSTTVGNKNNKSGASSIIARSGKLRPNHQPNAANSLAHDSSTFTETVVTSDVLGSVVGSEVVFAPSMLRSTTAASATPAYSRKSSSENAPLPQQQPLTAATAAFHEPSSNSSFFLKLKRSLSYRNRPNFGEDGQQQQPTSRSTFYDEDATAAVAERSSSSGSVDMLIEPTSSQMTRSVTSARMHAMLDELQTSKLFTEQISELQLRLNEMDTTMRDSTRSLTNCMRHVSQAFSEIFDEISALEQCAAPGVDAAATAIDGARRGFLRSMPAKEAREVKSDSSVAFSISTGRSAAPKTAKTELGKCVEESKDWRAKGNSEAKIERKIDLNRLRESLEHHHCAIVDELSETITVLNSSVRNIRPSSSQESRISNSTIKITPAEALLITGETIPLGQEVMLTEEDKQKRGSRDLHGLQTSMNSKREPKKDGNTAVTSKQQLATRQSEKNPLPGGSNSAAHSYESAESESGGTIAKVVNKIEADQPMAGRFLKTIPESKKSIGSTKKSTIYGSSPSLSISASEADALAFMRNRCTNWRTRNRSPSPKGPLHELGVIVHHNAADVIFGGGVGDEERIAEASEDLVSDHHAQPIERARAATLSRAAAKRADNDVGARLDRKRFF